jgi:DeoR/GlpR family transcriptional regulator of sugar metabolism
MLTTSRKAALLERLARDGQLVVTPLAEEFRLSEDTLRRDLRELAAEGKLVRVHGGAVPASPTHLPLDARRNLHGQEKSLLAQAGAGLIENGQLVIIDGGTTHVELATFLPHDRRCTIVTHSPAIATSFEHHTSIEVVLVGGRLFRHSMVAIGPETADAFGRIRADLCFLGLTGIHPELGLTTGDSNEASLKRIMMGAAADTIVLATPDKIGRASPWGIATLSELSTLVSIGDRPAWLSAKTEFIGPLGRQSQP